MLGPDNAFINLQPLVEHYHTIKASAGLCVYNGLYSLINIIMRIFHYANATAYTGLCIMYPSTLGRELVLHDFFCCPAWSFWKLAFQRWFIFYAANAFIQTFSKSRYLISALISSFSLKKKKRHAAVWSNSITISFMTVELSYLGFEAEWGLEWVTVARQLFSNFLWWDKSRRTPVGVVRVWVSASVRWYLLA